MTVVKSEFFLALNQVATERGISPEDVLESIQAAVLAAYKKDYGAPDDEESEDAPVVDLHKQTGEFHILQHGKDITPPGFGRIAAQTARQVILQKIREAEKREVVKHYSAKIGGIIKGRVIRSDSRNVYFDLNKAEGILPADQRIRSENYTLNQVYTLYIKEIVEDEHGNNPIILSRTAPELVYELFKKEVPEIAGDTVFIKGVVREPGERTKIAVYSKQAGVDPVGACVGQKGIRVKAVNDDLGLDEKIDIIQYNEDDALFIREALSPAKVKDVEVDKKTKVAKVTVDEEQAPLAIGKHGINVNLASKLTGYQLDIIQEQSDQAAVSHKEEISQDAPQATEPVLSEGEDTAPVTEEATATPSEETPSVTEEVSEEAA